MTTYAEAYAEYIAIPDQIVALRKASQAAFNDAIAKKWRETYPRRRKLPALPHLQVDQEWLNAEKTTRLSEHAIKETELKTRKEELSAWMFDHAPEVAKDIRPTGLARVLATKSSYDYGSQGWGANKYAEGWLLPYKALCEAHSIPAEIRVIREDVIRGQFGTDVWRDYGLFAPLEDWQYSALKCLMTEDCFKARGTLNPRVYNPFLPYE